MDANLLTKITQYVKEHIEEFHTARIEKLKKLKMEDLLKSKNPYMYKAKNITTAAGMVEGLASSFMASAEESIFGNWLEGLAIFISKTVYGGYKSSANGVDLEFDKEGVHFFVSIKSGPKWSNSTSLKKQKEQFVAAVRAYNTSRSSVVATMCIEGCCYGNDNKSYNDSTHEKYCGEKFWTLISGDSTLFVDIIEPLGHDAKEKNDAYNKIYAQTINKFTGEFISNYCNSEGSIDWEKIIKLNAAIKVPRAKTDKSKKTKKKQRAK